MKITKAKLKQIIKEELSSLMEHGEETGHLMKSDGSMIMDQKIPISNVKSVRLDEHIANPQTIFFR